MIRTFSDYTLRHQKRIIQEIADNLSEGNKEEIRLVYKEGVSLFDALLDQATQTETGLVLANANGELRGLGGVFPDHSVWFVVTNNLTMSDKIHMLKSGYKWFNRVAEKYHTLHGWCYVNNTQAMRWIKWLGFDFASINSQATRYLNNTPFLYFQKNLNERRQTADVHKRRIGGNAGGSISSGTSGGARQTEPYALD